MFSIQNGLPELGTLLLHTYKEIASMGVSQPARILLVDDEPENLNALKRTLGDKFHCVGVTNGVEALSLIEKEDFAVIVSDQKMPQMLGVDLLAEAAKKKPLATRVILTAHTEVSDILRAINRAEIYRYILKPWENQELISVMQQAAERHQLLKENQNLIAELKNLNLDLEKAVEKRTLELKLANERLSELAMTDPLTNLLNKRAFSKKLLDEVDRSSRYHHPLTVAMIDVDHFKHFNDTEGHVLGDEALKKISQVFLGNLRKSDSVGRFGGEEFIIMMPETKLQSGLEICERLRSSIEQEKFQGREKASYLTISVGLSVFPEAGETAESLITSADRALYEAKQSGRNRVMTYQHVQQSSFFIT